MNIEEIGKIVLQRRRFLRVTQKDLAEIAQVSLRSIKAIEKGKSNPNFSQIKKILDALGLSITTEERIKNA